MILAHVSLLFTNSAALTTENLRNTMVTVDAMKTANKEIKKQYAFP